MREARTLQRLRRGGQRPQRPHRDEHARNFSFLLGEDRRWVLAPAYDLTFSHGPNGEQSMLLLGKGARLA
jgi:serine/threonine protein kinase HipA of HipAB toxin-antitoxin module